MDGTVIALIQRRIYQIEYVILTPIDFAIGPMRSETDSRFQTVCRGPFEDGKEAARLAELL